MENDVGVIAPYRKQVTVIRDLLTCNLGVEVNTVDQYQGRDKDVIIISLTRSFTSAKDTETKVHLYKPMNLACYLNKWNVHVYTNVHVICMWHCNFCQERECSANVVVLWITNNIFSLMYMYISHYNNCWFGSNNDFYICFKIILWSWCPVLHMFTQCRRDWLCMG